ncbi:MAG TPA: outer membrane protein assembly factor BamA [Candidatus Krumholzibacterium sp.]|nr:outer membrane protein assembly factor BamA [Candidatus Krumholzibacterium sp.]
MSIGMVFKYVRYKPGTAVAIIWIVLSALSAPGQALSQDFEAELPYVDRIVILGNRSFDDGILKKRMRTREAGFFSFFGKPLYRRDFLRRDLETIRTFYNRNGFFAASVTLDSLDRDDKENSVSIRIMINEGPQTTVRKLSFGQQDLIPAQNLRKGLVLIEGNPYNPNLVDTDRYTLFSKFFEKGYLGAKVSAETVVDSIHVDVSWKMVPGKPVRIRNINVQGNEGVAERLIRRELKIRSGEFFNLAAIVRSKQNLYDTGCFSSVEIEPRQLDVETGSVDLQLQVRERKMGYIETGFGVGNVNANRIFAEWGQRNLFGRGYALNIDSEFAFSIFRDSEYSFDKLDFQNKFERHQGELIFPHVLGSWNTFSVGAFYERDATVDPVVVEATSYNGTVSRRFSKQMTLLFGYFFEKVRREEVVDEKKKSRRRSIDLTFRRDTRDFYFNPKRGTYVGLEGRLAGGIIGGDDDYYSLIPSYQQYRQLTEETVFAFRVRGGYARAFGDSRDEGLPIESRFFLGGGNSIRGYEENSLGPIGDNGEPRGGGVMLLTNVELRFPLPWIGKYNFGGAVFADGGNTWDSLEDITLENFGTIKDSGDVTPDDYRLSIGFGVRYYTPVGPIRFDVGYPLVKTDDIDYGYRIHISLGQIF